MRKDFCSTTYTLQDTSPAIDVALDLGAMGERDFFGNPIPFKDAYDIGAHEWTPEKSGSALPQELIANLGNLYPPWQLSPALSWWG